MAKSINENDLRDDGQRQIHRLIEHIKNSEDIRGQDGKPDIKLLYQKVYDKEPSKKELQVFYNRLNPHRANPTARFLISCIQNLPSIQDLTVADFFGIEDTLKD